MPTGSRQAEAETLVLELLLETTRSLLWIETAEDARELAARFVSAVGARVVEASEEDDGALPLDLSFGAGTPVVPAAPAGSEARRMLERHLPLLVADINRAIALGSRVERLSEDASLDALTRIPNRQTLGRGLGRLQVGDVVILLDLDGFKEVNDSQGHSVGDAVLRAFGETLSSTRRSRDLVGRYGGEEFVILLDGGDADAFLRRFRRNWMARRPLPVTFSAGVAACSPAVPSAASVTAAADRAMYRAKRAGRDQWLWATADEYTP